MPDTYQETIRLKVEVDSSGIGSAVQSEQQRANQRLRQQTTSGGVGFSGFFGGAKNFGTESYIDSVWKRVQSGTAIDRMGKSALENKLRDAQKRGELKIRDDIAKIVADHFNKASQVINQQVKLPTSQQASSTNQNLLNNIKKNFSFGGASPHRLNWDAMRGAFGITNSIARMTGIGRAFGLPQYQMMSMARMFGGMGNPAAPHYQSIRASEINKMAREAAQARTTRTGVTPQAIASETKAYFETLKGLRQTAEQIIKGSLASGKLILPMTMGGQKFDAASQAYKDLAQSMGYSVGDFQKSGPFSQASIGPLGGKSQKFGKSDEDKALIEEEKKRLVLEEIKKKAEADKKIAEQAMKAAATGAKFVGGLEIAASVAIQMGQVLKSISSALSNFAASFATGDVSKAMHGVVDALQGIAHGIGAGTSAIVGSIGLAIGSTFGPIGTMIGAAAGALVGNILGGALSAIAGLFNTFITAMDSLVDNLSKWNPTLAAANAQLNVNTIIFQRQMSYAMQPAILAWLNLKEIILDKLISYAPQINQLANYIADLIGYLGELINAIVPLTKLFVQMVHLVWDTLIRPVLKLSVALMEIINPVIWLIGNFHILGDVIKLFSDGLTNGLIKLLEVFAMIAEKLNFHTIAKDLFDAAADIKKGADATLTAAELQKQAAEWGKAFVNSLGDFAKAHGSGTIDSTRPVGAALSGLIGAGNGGGLSGNNNLNVQQALNNATGQILAGNKINQAANTVAQAGNTMNQAANTVAQAANTIADAAKTTATAADVALAANKLANPAGATAAQIAAANFIAQGHGKYNVDFGPSSQNQYYQGINGGVSPDFIRSHQWFKDKIYKAPWSTAFGSRNRLKYPGYMPYNQWADIVGASQGTGLGRYPDTGSTIGAMGSKYGSSGSYSDSGNIFGAMGNKYGGSDLSPGYMTFQQWRLRKLQRAGQKNLHGQNIDDPDYSGVDPNLVWAYKLRAWAGIDKPPPSIPNPAQALSQASAASSAGGPTTQPSTPSQAFIQSIGGKTPDISSPYAHDDENIVGSDSWKKARNITTDAEKAILAKHGVHSGPQMPHAALALNAQFNNSFNMTLEEQEVMRAIWQVRERLLDTFNCHRNETQLWLATLEGSMIADSV